MVSEIAINGRKIGRLHSPYIIAEMSGNHNQTLDQALSILDAAANIGADAIKLQTYTADTLTLDSPRRDFIISDENSLWSGKSLYELYREAYTPWDWIELIFTEARKRNIDCFSSIFDEGSIDFLENLNAPAYKISSFENNHIPLIRKAAATKKPLIISTGASSEANITEAVENAREAGCTELALLKCTSDYPAAIADSNLSCIPYLRDKYNCVIGLSDHTLGIAAAIGGVALGASIVEKHFIVSRDQGGVDSSFSADKAELKQIVRDAKNVWGAIGKPDIHISEREVASLMYKRSIYACQQIKKGEIFTVNNIRIIRPGFGLHPRHYTELIGTVCHSDLTAGDRLDISFLTGGS